MAWLGNTKSTLKLAWPEEPIPQRLAFTFPKTQSTQAEGWFGWLRVPRFAAWTAMTASCFVVCVASWALFRTQVQIGSNGIQVAFGQASQPALVPAPMVAPVTSGMRVEEVQHLIDERLAQMEQGQNVRLQRALLEARKELQTLRSQDLQQINAGMRYLETNQKSMIQDAAKNSINVQSLARNFYAKAEPPAGIQ